MNTFAEINYLVHKSILIKAAVWSVTSIKSCCKNVSINFDKHHLIYSFGALSISFPFQFWYSIHFRPTIVNKVLNTNWLNHLKWLDRYPRESRQQAHCCCLIATQKKTSRLTGRFWEFDEGLKWRAAFMGRQDFSHSKAFRWTAVLRNICLKAKELRCCVSVFVQKLLFLYAQNPGSHIPEPIHPARSLSQRLGI